MDLPKDYKERQQAKDWRRYWNNRNKYKSVARKNYHKNKHRYYCSACDIYCCNKSKFERHCATNKHKFNIN